MPALPWWSVLSVKSVKIYYRYKTPSYPSLYFTDFMNSKIRKVICSGNGFSLTTLTSLTGRDTRTRKNQPIRKI